MKQTPNNWYRHLLIPILYSPNDNIQGAVGVLVVLLLFSIKNSEMIFLTNVVEACMLQNVLKDNTVVLVFIVRLLTYRMESQCFTMQ